MSKTGICSCGQTVTIPKAECLFQCHRCGQGSVFLCHVLGQPKDPMHIRCKECKIMYSMYNCPQCDAFAVIKGFQSGKMYNCLCGFQSTMIGCNRCTALLCLPTRKNYEMTRIKCKKCDNQFRYRLCPSCGECTYGRADQNVTEMPACFNQQCPIFKVSTQKEQKETVKVMPPQFKRANIVQQANPYQQLMPSQKKQAQLCNICLIRQKCMINTSCYHLSVCQPCSRELKGHCPICRSVGQYKMVFRS